MVSGQCKIQREQVLVDFNPIEDGYKPIPNIASDYLVNKYGEVVRDSPKGYRYVAVRRTIQVKSTKGNSCTVDIDKEIEKLFWS